jgi:hypothetical protein
MKIRILQLMLYASFYRNTISYGMAGVLLCCIEFDLK